MKKLLTALFAVLIAASLVMSALAYPMYVSADPGKVRKQPNKKADVISRLPHGDMVDVFEQDGDWLHITYINKKGVQKSGWIHSKNVTDQQPHRHDWGEWQVTKKATCEHSGKKERTCKGCGKTQKKEIKKTGHQWSKWHVRKEATCTTQGEQVRTCQNCDKTETRAYFADHSFGAWSMTKAPTCTETGERVRTCNVCGKEERQALDKTPHEYELRVIQEATSNSQGVRAKICVNCGFDGGEERFDPEGTLRRGDRGEAVRNMQQLLVEQGYLNAGGADGVFGGGSEKALMKYQQDRGLTADGVAWPETLDDLQHDFGPWVTVKEMTRTEAGERVRTCQGCGFEQRMTVEPGNMMERGSRGEDVRAMQQMVKQLGFDAGGFDGIYGKKLDAALAQFAESRGLHFQDGVIRPGDVDAVFNAWLAVQPEGSWKGEGGIDSPVDLALSVDAVGEPDDSGTVNYNWSVTNLGQQNVTFAALLLTFGDTPDFTQDNMVMVLDGYTLKAASGNSGSGSITVDEDWGKGNLHFAVMAIDDSTGDIWLSNAVDFGNSNSADPRTIHPVATSIDLNNIADAVLPVSFNQGDIASLASGVYINAIHVYSMDTYDPAQIEALRPGDTLMVSGEAVAVETAALEPEDPEMPEVRVMQINGGEDEGGYTLISTPESTGYVVRMLSDMATYTELGVINLALDASATYTDSSNIEAEPVTYAYGDIAGAIQNDEYGYFVQYNTTIHVVGGRIVEIKRDYVP